MTLREFTSSTEWAGIADRLRALFEIHTQMALLEEKDIGTVRYHKGWIDAINEFLELPAFLLSDPDEDREPLIDNREPGQSFIATKKDGSVY